MRLCALGVASVLALGATVAGCGDNGGGDSQRLSPAAYRAQLAALGERAGKTQADVEKALKARSVSEVSTLIAAFGLAQQRLGDDVDKINPPADADAANTQLADGAHQFAAEIRATVDALSQAKTPKQAVALLDQRLGNASGVKKFDAALSELHKLGYTKSG